MAIELHNILPKHMIYKDTTLIVSVVMFVNFIYLFYQYCENFKKKIIHRYN